MIDKDLDGVLSDLGSETNQDGARDETHRIQKRGEDAEGPGGEEPFFRRIAGLQLTGGILLFRGGVLQAVQNHQEFCKTFRMTSIDKESEAGVEEILRQYKYTYIRSIENIEKLYEDYTLVLNPHTIEKAARKDYGLYFEGFEDRNRVQFLVLREMFIELREFNSLVKKEWRELSKSIGVINLSASGKPLYQSLNSVVDAASAFCSATDEFLKYLGAVLAVPEGHLDLLKSEVQGNTTYHDEYSYAYDDIFEPGRYGGKVVPVKSEVPGAEDLVPPRRDGAAGSSARDRAAAPENQETPPALQGIPAQEPDAETGFFTVKGTRPWNTREPYIIRLNREKLEKDMADLSASFYFLQTPVDDKVLEGEIKRSILRSMRDGGHQLQNAYGEFILKSVFSRIHDITEFFGAGDMLSLFMYHTGPLPVYMAVLDAFMTGGIGHCFRYGAGKRVTRFMPQEFIKRKVLEWFENNVNVFDLPFDSIQEYETVRKLVTKKYYAAVDDNNRKVDELIEASNLKADPRFDRAEYVKARWKELYGPANIFVYNRFLEKTIFK
jgi:hypothetical protein